jgi:1-acyl-sn-glycerol-3-phosphate acyltransferase
VVLIANHQSEADPAVFALLLEKTFPKLAQGGLGWMAGGGCAC